MTLVWLVQEYTDVDASIPRGIFPNLYDAGQYINGKLGAARQEHSDLKTWPDKSTAPAYWAHGLDAGGNLWTAMPFVMGTPDENAGNDQEGLTGVR